MKPMKKAGKNQPLTETVVNEQNTTVGQTTKAVTGQEAMDTPPAISITVTPTKARTPGVSHSRTRPYLAGLIIKKHGPNAGVTEKMIAELDTAFGKPNRRESEFCLRNAWHAIRGYNAPSGE